MKLSKKITNILLSLLLIIGISTNSFAAIPEYGEEYKNKPNTQYAKTFKDVPKSYWAFEYIMEMVDRGVLSGYPNGYFYPNNKITRAEFSKIMCIASGLTINSVNSTSYTDVSLTSWYLPYVETGKYYLSGYISNGEKYYLPESNALREDIAVALVKLKGYDISIYDESILKAMFTDYKSISQDARKYVSVAIENGLISGYDDNTFRGQDSVTRAEAATLLWRAYQYGNGNKIFDKEVLDEPTKEEIILSDTNNKITKDEIIKEQEIVNEQKTTEVEEKSEYLYELKTVGTNVTGMYSMISTNDGAFYLYDNIYEVSKDGNSVKTLLDINNLEYIGNEEVSKADKEKLMNWVTCIGYDPLLNKRYCILTQCTITTTAVYLYDLDTGNYIDISKIMLTDEIQNSKSNFNRSYRRFIINEFNNILRGSTFVDYINNKLTPIKVKDLGVYSQLYVNNNIYIVDNKYIYLYDKRTGTATEELDYYIDEQHELINSDDKNFYFKSKKNLIYKIDTNGEIKTIIGIDDIDNVDGKIINIDVINSSNSAISPDGTMYYWDINYNCIRQLSHK